MAQKLGLSAAEVYESRRKNGSNEIKRTEQKGFLSQYIQSFDDPTIKILLVAFGLNLIFLVRNAEWLETIGMAAAILIATLISTVSEYGSKMAFEALLEEAQKGSVKAYREGRLQEIKIGEIVVGDVVKLEAADKVFADAIVIEGAVRVDQSALNGESKDVRKQACIGKVNEMSENMDLCNPNYIYSGSIVTEGVALIRVNRVGNNTYYGKIAQELTKEEEESPLKIRLRKLALQISRLGYIAAILVGISVLFNELVIDNGFERAQIMSDLLKPQIMLQHLLKALTLAVTVIVVAVPEGLPLMITVVLSSNMRRMIKDNVLVRKLVGVETAGSINVLFTDKTGTLTEGKLSVVEFINGGGIRYGSVNNLEKHKELYKLVYASCVYNNAAEIGQQEGKRVAIGGNSTDRALAEYVMNKENCLPCIRRTDRIEFKSELKYAATRIEGELNTTLIKGAPEVILPRCNNFYNIMAIAKPIVDKSVIENSIKELAKQGIRIICLATSNKAVVEGEELPKLTLVGILAVRDKVRDNARRSVREVIDSGIQVVMMTGDSVDTAVAIADEVGLISASNPKGVLTSAQLRKMTDEEIRQNLGGLRIIARAIPTDKSRLVRIAQESNYVVGMTGDGINDAPALKKADIGFVMGSGTEVAKEAGDIIILDNNFMSIGKAILYGRTIFKSIRKFIIFQLTVNICAVIVSMVAPFIGVDSAITVVQMLWVNMVMDTLAGLAFAGEAPLPEYMKEKPKHKNEEIINKYMISEIVFTGLYTALISLAFLKSERIRSIFNNSEQAFMTGFFAFFIFAAIFNSMNARTARISLIAQLSKNRAFVGIILFIGAVQMLLIYNGGEVFRCFGLNFTELLVTILLAMTVIPVDLIRKLALRKKYKRNNFGT